MSNLWYTKNLLMSKNKIISMALGARGTGKTYCYTHWCISDYKKTGSIAIWVRRWQTELDEILENDKFFRAVKQDFPNDVFTIKKNTAYSSVDHLVQMQLRQPSNWQKPIQVVAQ